MYSVFGCIGVLLCAGQIATAQSQGSKAAAEQLYLLKLERIIIPRLEFRDATLAEALQFLERRAIQVDPTYEHGPSIVLPETIRSTPPPSRLDFSRIPERVVTLSLRNVSLNQAILHVAAVAGVGVIFNRDGFRIETPSPGVVQRLSSRVDDARLSPVRTKLLGKARRIVIPRLEFREATVYEALTFLQKRCEELDNTEQPGIRGINMVLLAAAGRMVETRVTISAREMPMLDLFIEIARQIGAELRVSDVAFIFDCVSRR